MERTVSREIKRQIGFAETMKQRATEKFEAKIADYDAKIEELQEKLTSALAEEQADTVSAK